MPFSTQYASLAEKRGRPPALAIAMVDADAEVRQIKIDGELRLVTGDEWNSLRETGANYELVRVVLPRGKLLNLTAREAALVGSQSLRMPAGASIICRMRRADT